ncbi:MAG: hypothetical protein QOI53_1211 [Verrucomicrobiota bacterium]|jgi:hypothetical protein|nr:hypothetical protein [Verrucomicrobiota bacterium]
MLTLQGSANAHAAHELNKAIDRARRILAMISPVRFRFRVADRGITAILLCASRPPSSDQALSQLYS